MKDFHCIDIHSHLFPQAYLRLIADEGTKFGVSCSFADPEGPVIDFEGQLIPLDRRFYDIDSRLASMDEQGVDVHALSLTRPMLYWASSNLSRKLSEAFNDACVEAHQAHPDRFVGLAILPVQEPDLAIKELDRVAKLPGIRGIYMLSVCVSVSVCVCDCVSV